MDHYKKGPVSWAGYRKSTGKVPTMWLHASHPSLRHVRPATDGYDERKDCFPVLGGQLVPNEPKECLRNTPSQCSHFQKIAIQRCKISNLESFLRCWDPLQVGRDFHWDSIISQPPPLSKSTSSPFLQETPKTRLLPSKPTHGSPVSICSEYADTML